MSDRSHLTIHLQDEVAIVRFNDATILDASQIDAVSRELFDLIDKQNLRQMAIDLGSLQMISSQTLGVFLEMRKKIDALGGQMVFCGIDPKLYRVFKITNLISVFQFYDDTDSAVQSFSE